MTALKSAKRTPAPPAAPPASVPEPSTGESKRKPWVKKTPAEVVLAQIERVREDVAKKEEELNKAKRQLQKLEEAKRVLEST